MGWAMLAGRVAIVTGAGRGLGRGIATTLAPDGAIVVATGRDHAAHEPTEAWIPLPLEEVREVRLRLRGDAAATSLCFLPPAGPGSGGG